MNEPVCCVCNEPVSESERWCQVVNMEGKVLLHVHERCMDVEKLAVAMWGIR